MTITRRELFGLAAGGAAVAVLPKAAEAKTYTVEEIANKVWQAEEIEVKEPPKEYATYRAVWDPHSGEFIYFLDGKAVYALNTEAPVGSQWRALDNYGK